MNPNQNSTQETWEEQSSRAYERMMNFANLIEVERRVEVESIIPPGYFYMPYVRNRRFPLKPKPKLFVEVDEKELDF